MNAEKPRPGPDGVPVGRIAPRVRDDTIAAQATAAGRAAIAIIRVSGAAAERIARRVVAPWPEVARAATRCRVHEPDEPAALIDEGLVVHYPAPRSYTGETVVELQVHGGPYVAGQSLAALILAGARQAEPGEFTTRAVLNGKLDLVEAEGIGDLIDARSAAAHRTAIHQLSGVLSARYASLREELIGLEALLAYDIDFPEEDAGQLPLVRIRSAGDALIAKLDALLATAPAAILGREGATAVLAGPPNAGKSSLLNALIGEARVIVSDEPGTTRDAVEVLLDQEPWPLRLVDTAGLRSGAGAIEQKGIEVAERYLAAAHLVIACADNDRDLERTVAHVRELSAAPIVGARTKADLRGSSNLSARVAGIPVVDVSATTGNGVPALLSHLNVESRALASAPDLDAPVVARARQRVAIEHARDELRRFLEAWGTGQLPAPVAATHVRAATHALDELIGAVDVDDVFARVFATFCVGK